MNAFDVLHVKGTIIQMGLLVSKIIKTISTSYLKNEKVTRLRRLQSFSKCLQARKPIE